MTIIYYTATGAFALKNWEIMTRPNTNKLTYNDPSEFWPFHEKILTHINNMDWNDVLIFPVAQPNAAPAINMNLYENFGQIPTSNIEHRNNSNPACRNSSSYSSRCRCTMIQIKM